MTTGERAGIYSRFGEKIFCLFNRFRFSQTEFSAPLPGAVSFSHPVAGEGVWRQGHHVRRGVIERETASVSRRGLRLRPTGGRGTVCGGNRNRRARRAWPLSARRGPRDVQGVNGGKRRGLKTPGRPCRSPQRPACVNRSRGAKAATPKTQSGPRNAKAGGHHTVPGQPPALRDLPTNFQRPRRKGLQPARFSLPTRGRESGYRSLKTRAPPPSRSPAPGCR